MAGAVAGAEIGLHLDEAASQDDAAGEPAAELPAEEIAGHVPDVPEIKGLLQSHS